MKLNQGNRIWKLFGIDVFFIIVIILIPSFLGVATGQIFETFTSNKVSFYQVTSMFCLILINILFFYEVYATKGDKQYGDSYLFVSQGELPATSLMKNVSNMGLFLYSMSGMSILSTIVFVLFGNLSEKVTISTSPILDMFLVIGENIMLASLIALLILLFRWLARRYSWNKNTFILLVWASVIVLSGAFGWIMHMVSKVGLVDQLIYSAIFWTVTGLIQLIVGSILIAISFHYILDFPFYMNILFSDATVITFFIVIAIITGYLGYKIPSKNIAYSSSNEVQNGFTND